MPTSLWSRASVGLVLLFGGCAFPAVWVEADEKFEIPVAGVKELECTTMNATIDVQASAASAQTVSVQVRKRAGAIDEAGAREALSAIQIVKANEDGKVRLGWKWGTTKANDWQAAVSFAVVTTPDLATKLDTSNSSVSVARMNGPVVVSTSNASVKLDRCAGDWEVTTSNGGIDASGTPSSLALRTSNGAISAEVATKGTVNGKLRTSNGRIEARLGAETSTRVKAETSNGGVVAEGDWKIHDKGRTRIDASRQGGTGTLMLDTSNGSIRIE